MAEEFKNNINAEETSDQSNFKPIESQKDFDALVRERIERAKNSVKKEYEGFEDYKKKATEYDTKIADFEAKLAAMQAENEKLKGDIKHHETAAEKSRIAKEYGIPESLAGRLSGSKKEEWEMDAKELAKYFKQKPAYPSVDTTESTDTKKAELLQLSRSLRK